MAHVFPDSTNDGRVDDIVPDARLASETAAALARDGVSILCNDEGVPVAPLPLLAGKLLRGATLFFIR